MLEIASQITICLLIAALIGFIIGYIVAKGLPAKTINKEAEAAKGDTKAKTDAKETSKKAKSQAEKVETKTKATKEKAKSQSEAKATEKKEETESEILATEGEKPEILDAPRDGQKDDLTQIKGIGPKVADQLNEAGIYHYDQIASWTEANIKWLEIHTTFAHRATKDLWVTQAKSFK